MTGGRDDLALALEMADRADALTMSAFTGGELAFAPKGDGTPVTEADRLVEGALRTLVRERRPHDGFLGEETGGSAHGTRRWIVDPIDGTRSFVSGGRAWGTQIALEDRDRLVVGVTSAPAVGARWWADDRCGAFRRTRGDPSPHRLAVTDQTTLSAATWICHPPQEAVSGELRLLAERLAAACGDPLPVTSHGALMVAEGQLDICLPLEGRAWDHAAFAAIVQAAGGRFSYLDGSTELAGAGPALFTNGRLHAAALRVLQRRS